jgi:alpha-tubulin suppressor-like RCC1 family protein
MTFTRAIATVGLLLASVLTPGCNDSDPNDPRPLITLTGVSPSSGPMAGGTSVTITGTNFSDVTGVTIGGSELGSRTVVSPIQITGTTPPSTSSGAKDVVVTSSSRGSDTCSGCFSYAEDEAPPVLDFAALDLGDGHTCGLTTEGLAYCWGANGHSELGDGTRTNRNLPVPVSRGLTFSSLEAGMQHSCGLTAAGGAYCWGNNQGGALGDGTTIERSAPVGVVGGIRFARVSGGGDHNCGVTGENLAYCWGFNLSGQLGDGTTTMRTAPVAVAGGVSFVSVSAGALAHSCGLTAEGVAYCWGNNTEGELGNGTNDDQLTPGPVVGDLRFAMVSAGFGYTCGVTITGDAYCWGFNASGRLGTGAPVQTVQSSPGLVAGGLSFASVSVATGTTCGITTAGAAYCWGRNTLGELGDGTTDNRFTPVPVAGGLSFTEVRGGSQHTCGVTTEGDAYCWGDNQAGQLGNGTLNGSTVPVKVAGQ